MNLVHLTTGQDRDPVWSPDGKHIAFVRGASGEEDIYLVSKLSNSTWQDDTETIRLTQHDSADLAPAWSPDSRSIVFISSPEGTTEILTMRADGSKQRRLTNNGNDDLAPVWSADGKQIAFVSHLYGAGEIFIMNADGSEQRRLTNNGAEDAYPDW